ncbi:FliH/SctL family protein [Candidatus Acidulodesulfobacterium sp. H_13]|uniref:FliH/SctL family protein n=1 Tax=Candidatus Acidulodesulfobacterium sp. H_13 TaxID=3395470 RepID=UPI003AF9E0DB
MNKILKDNEFNIEGNTIYDGKKTLLVNILKTESKQDDEELVSTLGSVPATLQKFIISYLENHKHKTEKTLEKKEQNILENAEKRGYSRGFSEGKKEADRLTEEGIKNILKAAGSIEKFKNELYRDVKRDVIDLSLNIAKAIIKSEVETNRDLIMRIIADAIDKAGDTVNFTIYLNSADYGTLNKNPDAIKNFTAKESNIEFLPDRNISQGDVIIKTDFGEIDARIETQIEQIKKIFTKVAPG